MRQNHLILTNKSLNGDEISTSEKITNNYPIISLFWIFDVFNLQYFQISVLFSYLLFYLTSVKL